jgi:hypothetical protein
MWADNGKKLSRNTLNVPSVLLPPSPSRCTERDGMPGTAVWIVATGSVRAVGGVSGALEVAIGEEKEESKFFPVELERVRLI